MRKKILFAVVGILPSLLYAQDSLKTTLLNEVVVTGTKFDLPVEKSGKTIFKLDRNDIERNAGKTLADLLQEIPGVQADGNFSTPGSNLSYYVRGGRNKHTLILIDGVPFNDPSAINAEYDLRYIPLSQIESIEVFKGGLSTLYGTSASAGVISIKLKETSKEFSGMVDVSAASFGTYSQNAQVSGTSNKFSYLISGSNVTSNGFSSAQDNDPLIKFDKDGFSRQNGLVKFGYRFTDKFSIGLQSAYEQFEADYDAYEFADDDNRQKYNQIRVGLTPKFTYAKGDVEARIFYNVNERVFKSSFPSEYEGKNIQGELIHRHRFSEQIQTLAGVNFQHMAFDEVGSTNSDSANFTLLDPYVSFFIDLPAGLNVHAGARLNTHSLYGSKLIYNLNPSFVFNTEGTWKYKILGSISTSYITPSLYQMYSFYGNTELEPEESLNYEAGFSILNEGFSFNAVGFKRKETDLIDFVSLFDGDGNWIGGQYRNINANRTVDGFELNVDYTINTFVSVAANYTYMDTDRSGTFYKIPNTKYGASVSIQPSNRSTVSVKYNFTGERKTFDFNSFSEVTLKNYQLVDVFASYNFLENKLRVYGSVNNVFDEKFVAIYGYTTRGRNFSIGVTYNF
jgi:vitamin B12 transporter